MYSNLKYDPVKDLQPVVLLNTVTQAFTINPDVGVSTLKELIDLAKKEPAKLSYASAGIGSLPHLGAEMFKKSTGTDIQHIPYRGSVQAFTDVLAGRVNMYIGALATPLPQIQAGKLKCLAVINKSGPRLFPTCHRSSSLVIRISISLPITACLRRSEYRGRCWIKFVAAVQEALQTPDLKKVMDELGNELVGDGPEKFEAFLNKSMQTWRRGLNPRA